MNDFYLKISKFDILYDSSILRIDLFSNPELYVELLKFRNFNHELSFSIYKRRRFLFFNFDKKVYEFESNQIDLLDKVSKFVKKYNRSFLLKKLI